MTFFHVTSNPHLLVLLGLVKLEVNLSEHVLLIESELSLGLLECLLVDLSALLEFSQLLVLSLELPLDVGLFNEAGVHVLLNEQLQSGLLLDELLQQEVRKALQEGIGGVLIEDDQLLLLLGLGVSAFSLCGSGELVEHVLEVGLADLRLLGVLFLHNRQLLRHLQLLELLVFLKGFALS